MVYCPFQLSADGDEERREIYERTKHGMERRTDNPKILKIIPQEIYVTRYSEYCDLDVGVQYLIHILRDDDN